MGRRIQIMAIYASGRWAVPSIADPDLWAGIHEPGPVERVGVGPARRVMT
jgi:hypothetical protein